MPKVSTYILTPFRRGRILAHRRRLEAEGATPPPPANNELERRTLGGGEHVRCQACGKAIRLMSWVVARPSRRTKYYHYRCWRWGGVQKSPTGGRPASEVSRPYPTGPNTVQ